jgi:hypothetical protein
MKDTHQFQLLASRPIENDVRRNGHLPETRTVHRNNGRPDERTLQKEVYRPLNPEEFVVSSCFACER